MSAEVAETVTVTCETEVDDHTARRYYELYRRTFGELATKAVARQLLHEHEFLEEMRDPRVEKYVARDAAGETIGMTTLTRHLETVPWISPDYFAHHYPEHTARGAVFYLGFTLVERSRRSARVFQAMIATAARVVVAERGVCAWDICRHNDETFDFGGSIKALLQRTAEVTVGTIDRQTYYAGTFTGGPPRA
jgi:hypothetical protein